VVETARFIWLVSLVYLVLGSGVLTAIAIFEGMKPLSAAFHSVCVFMAAWDTGGFTPQSQNILYYHSLPFEVATMSLMLLGGLNFKLHYAVWHGQRKEIFKNIEPITLFITIMATMALVCFGLGKTGMYSQPLLMFRKGFYHIISAHTGTGYGTLYAEQFRKEWGDLALTGIILAMGFGAGACSTSGGIKNLRLGLIFKALRQDIKKIILPESAVVVEKFQHIRKIILEDKTVRAAALILLCYVVLYLLGTIVGLFCGYPLNLALFESTSAAANVGLSCGITQAAMPAVLKVTYIIQMWAGRLEFMSVFAFIGLIYAAFKGK
jgi:trk system potassium uptake protein TrkH